MLPAFAEWIAHLSRMSGKSVTARTSRTPHDWFVASPASSRPIASRVPLRDPSAPTTYFARIVEVSPVASDVLQVLELDGDRVLRGAAGVDRDVVGVQAVERRQLGRRPLHVVEQIGEHPRLVDDHVGHLGEALFDVVDAPGPRDPARVGGVRPPERDLVDRVPLVDQLVGQAERLEHLHAAARDAVGLADLQRAVLAVDDHGPDVGEVGQLRGQDQSGRTGADDQDVGLLRQAFRALGDRRVRVLDERVAGLVAVEIELHVARLSWILRRRAPLPPGPPASLPLSPRRVGAVRKS